MKRLPLPLAFLLLASLAACHRKKEVVVVVDGPVVVVEEPQSSVPVVAEAEPNDEVIQANFLGVLFPGDQILIDGAISSTVTDLFDGFAFVAAEPIRVEFALLADNSADLDLCVYDPILDDFSLCFENEGDEIDAFDVIYADAEFHVVVTPFDLPGGYRLEITALPLAFTAGLASAPPVGPELEATGAIRGSTGSSSAQSAEGYRTGPAPATTKVVEAP